MTHTDALQDLAFVALLLGIISSVGGIYFLVLNFASLAFRQAGYSERDDK
ncbi:hypothetical protein [Agrobacterium rubi]|nr:hypothetical protein [Agrobacterium rubi]